MARSGEQKDREDDGNQNEAQRQPGRVKKRLLTREGCKKRNLTSADDDDLSFKVPRDDIPMEAQKTTPKPMARGPPMLRNFSLGAQTATVERPPTTPAVYLWTGSDGHTWDKKPSYEGYVGDIERTYIYNV